MKKNVLTFAMVIMALITESTYGQVGIGTMNPHKSAALDVTSYASTPLGALIPRMSEAYRDSIDDPANGLLIFNTDEGCINSYDKENKQWNSLCGGVGKSVFSLNCTTPSYSGVYMEGSPLNNSNYLTVTVNVEKEGIYTLSASTENGYGFYSSGTFMNKGVQLVTLIGQGSPLKESSGDEVSFFGNGIIYDCRAFDPLKIPVGPANPTYTMDCSSVTVNGTYISGTSLKPSNNITVKVNITGIGNGQWSAGTNTVDGISFSGSGIFAFGGEQTITLNGYGTPTSAKAKTMTITVNSAGIAKTCTATVNLVFSPKTIVAMGSDWIQPSIPNNYYYGYSMNSTAPYAVAMNPANFGTPTSTVPMSAPFVIKGLNNTGGFIGLPGTISSIPNGTQIKNILTSATPPDIVFIGWGMTYDDTGIDAIINYLNNGGVVIIMNKFTSASVGSSIQVNGDQRLFSAIFGTNVTSTIIANASGTVLAPGNTAHGSIFQLASIAGDQILNGPFGNLKGLFWGNDYYPATNMTNIPDDQIVTYSGANVVGATAINPGVTMFKHKTLNLFWIGDGGFLSNLGSPNTWETNITTGAPYTRPFNVTGATGAANYLTAKPAPRNGYGGGVAYGGINQTVYNSQLFANVLAWAVQQAENNGINVGNHNPGNTQDVDPETP